MEVENEAVNVFQKALPEEQLIADNFFATT
jgi:hypothetical protein